MLVFIVPVIVFSKKLVVMTVEVKVYGLLLLLGTAYFTQPYLYVNASLQGFRKH